MSPDTESILESARNFIALGDYEKAGEILLDYIESSPDSREARLLLGATLARDGKYGGAEKLFSGLVEADPQDAKALNNTAVVCRRQGKFQDALEYLREAIDIEPTTAEFHFNMGIVHSQMDNSKAALMSYARAIELESAYIPAYINLGIIYQRLLDNDKACELLGKGLELDQKNPSLHFHYGAALEAKGLLDEAVNEFRTAIRGRPLWLAPVNKLGIVYFKQGQHKKAMSAFNRVLSVDPFNAEAFNSIGVVKEDLGRIQEAVKSYRRAIEANPRYVKAAINLERTLEASGDITEALADLKKLVKISPDSAEMRNLLAGLYLKMEYYPEALEQVELVLKGEEGSVQALRVKGAVQRAMGNDAEAQSCFEKILSLDPGNYAFLIDLADIHFHRKEYKEAEERIQSYLTQRPKGRTAKLLLGKLHAEMGDRTHAIQVFEELSREDPNDTEALSAAAELLKDAGSLEKALRTADNLVNLQEKRVAGEDHSGTTGDQDQPYAKSGSLEFYENAVDASSSSVREMWERNIKLMGKGEAPKDDISSHMGMGDSPAIDEETEVLFIEGSEPFGPVAAREQVNEDIASFEEEPLAEDEPLQEDLQILLAEEPPKESDASDAEIEAVESLETEMPMDDSEPFTETVEEDEIPETPGLQTDEIPDMPDSASQKPEIISTGSWTETEAKVSENRKAESAPGEDETPGLPAVVELLRCLVRLAEELPEKELQTYLDGKYPAVIETLIVKITNLF